MLYSENDGAVIQDGGSNYRMFPKIHICSDLAEPILKHSMKMQPDDKNTK